MILSIMKRRHNILAIIAVACCPFVTSAAPDANTPAAADIKALLQANGTGDIGNQVGPVTAQQIIITLHRVNPNLSASADAIVTDVVVTYMRQQAEHDRVVDRLIPIYSKYLTKDDVRQLTDFYRSPIGRKLVNVMPEISLESARVGQQWAESILPGLQAKLLDRLRAEKLIE